MMPLTSVEKMRGSTPGKGIRCCRPTGAHPFGSGAVTGADGFPEESEKFFTLGEIAWINQHLWALSKTWVKQEFRQAFLMTP
jgi:hypothetical protein